MRKQKVVKITEGTPETNRDYGRVYVITEMSASQVEDWATRAMLALGKSGVDLGNIGTDRGFAGIAILGFQALFRLDWKEVKPLLDEMMSCIKTRPNSKLPDFLTDLREEDIEELTTRLKLRMEVFELHAGFSIGGSALSTPQFSTQEAEELPPENGQNTPTSRKRLARSSPPGLRRGGS